MKFIRYRRFLDLVLCCLLILIFLPGCTGNHVSETESQTEVISPATDPVSTTGNSIPEDTNITVPQSTSGSSTENTAAETSGSTSENTTGSTSDSPSGTDPETILEGMSLEEKVGQMFIVRCPAESQLDSITKYHLGGYILFERDFENRSRQQVIDQTEAFQNTSQVKMLIAVDEEGGEVNRVSLNRNLRAVPFWSSQDLFKEGGWVLITSDTKEKAELLKALGINVNLAPVSDVSVDPGDYIYDRAFGKDAEVTSRYVETVVTEMSKEQLGSVLKHFPGYGNDTDTHTGISYDKRSYDQFLNSDFKPFEAGIKAGADAILVSHNIVESVDSKQPASLSPKIHDILRNDLNFQGVIMTDDLFMDAIKEYTGNHEAAVRAVLAGNDLICSTDFQVQIPAVIEAVKKGEISEDQIDASVLRILNWKASLGILN